jgi:3-oxoacyl-[acyl-carrier protein] reductase
MGQLEGRVAVVTGSTRGIGRAIAARFAAEGAAVVVNGRRIDDAERAAAEITSGLPGDAGRVVGIAADQASLEQIGALCRAAKDAFGTVDVLVNNAAIAPRSAITRVSDAEWDECLLVDLTAPFRYIRELVPGMKRLGRGAIVNVTSAAGMTGTVGFSSYSAAKGGLNALTYTLAQELAGFGIRTNLLSAGAMTDMMRQLPPEIVDPDTPLPSVDENAATALRLVVDPALNGRCLRPGEERDLPPLGAPA